MFDKLKGAAGTVTSKAGSLKDAGIEALQSTVEELNTMLPRLPDVGYSVNRVEVEIGISPKIILTLAKVFDVEVTAFAAMLAANAEKKVFCTILGALQKANELQGKIQFRDRHFKELEIELGIPPAVRMVFIEAEREPPPAPETSSSEREPVRVEGRSGRSQSRVPAEEEETDAELTPRATGTAKEADAPAPPPAAPLPAADELHSWLTIWCGGCRKHFRVSADKAGLIARCRRCGTTLRV
jgi:hypothetical protein